MTDGATEANQAGDHIAVHSPGAKEIKQLYDSLAPELQPVIVNYQMPKGYRENALKSLREGRSRVIVCVNMLGEGFDLPALKVAARHDPQKSLAVTLQADAQDIQRWMTQLLGRYSSAYASIQFRVLRQFFKWQAAEEDLPDPMARLRALNVTVTAVPETGQDACWLFLLRPERRRPGCLRSP